MLKINRLKDQAINERNMRRQLESQVANQAANLDYIAMMTGVDIPTEDATTTEGGTANVTEVQQG